MLSKEFTQDWMVFPQFALHCNSIAFYVVFIHLTWLAYETSAVVSLLSEIHYRQAAMCLFHTFSMAEKRTLVSQWGNMGTKFIQHFQIEFHDTFSMTLLHRYILFKNNIQKWFVFKDKLRCQKPYVFLQKLFLFRFSINFAKLIIFFHKVSHKNILEIYFYTKKFPNCLDSLIQSLF